MANEISMTASLSVAAGSASLTHSTTKQATQSTVGSVSRRYTATTSDTALTLTGVTTPRVIQITNMDATNYVDIGPESGGAIIGLIRLKAGETCVFPIKPSVVIRCQANTASCILEYLIAET